MYSRARSLSEEPAARGQVQGATRAAGRGAGLVESAGREAEGAGGGGGGDEEDDGARRQADTAKGARAVAARVARIASGRWTAKIAAILPDQCASAPSRSRPRSCWPPWKR